VKTARRSKPRWLLAAGLAPITARALREISDLGVRTIAFTTDDPWNANYRSPWLFDALASYDTVFTPRPATLADFRNIGCARVEELHFGFDPTLHHPATTEESAGEARTADVVFIGGGDKDRFPYIEALIETGLKVAAYGGYWNRNPRTRDVHGGMLSIPEMRGVLGGAKMSICLVRRANRDEHVMRTYEEPMMGACMAPEDTAQHRALFSDPVMEHAFFKTPADLAEVAVKLCGDDALRTRVKEAEYRAVAEGSHSYADRLRTMLDYEGEG